jgi:cobalt-precorrin 5A hydrolase
MDLDQAMIVAGVGCRKGASADDIGAVIGDALARAGVSATALDLIAAPELKRGERGIVVAAAALGVPLVLVPRAELEAAGARVQTRSERVLEMTGVPSVAEAAALAPRTSSPCGDAISSGVVRSAFMPARSFRLTCWPIARPARKSSTPRR